MCFCTATQGGQGEGHTSHPWTLLRSSCVICSVQAASGMCNKIQITPYGSEEYITVRPGLLLQRAPSTCRATGWS